MSKSEEGPYAIHCEECGAEDPLPESNILPEGWTKRAIDPTMPQKGYLYRCPWHPFPETV